MNPPRAVERDRARSRSVAMAGMIDAQARLVRLEALLRDPASWRWMAVHFKHVRDDAGQRGWEEWAGAASLLHRGAVEVLQLLGEDVPPEVAGE